MTRDDPFYPLRGATNIPRPLSPGGPPIFLGGQKPRGIRLAARRAQGWLLTGTEAGDAGYFADRLSEFLPALEAEGRDPATFEFVGQVHTGPDPASLATALRQARDLVRVGATEIVVGIPAGLGPAALEAATRGVRDPLRDEFGPAS